MSVRARAVDVDESGMPKHLIIGLTADGRGPADPPDPNFHHWGCWCGDPKCRVWRWTQHRPTWAWTFRVAWGRIEEAAELPAAIGFAFGLGPGRSLWFRTARRRWRMLA